MDWGSTFRDPPPRSSYGSSHDFSGAGGVGGAPPLSLSARLLAVASEFESHATAERRSLSATVAQLRDSNADLERDNRLLRDDLSSLNRTLKRIVAGQGRREDIDMLVAVANNIEGHTICALGDAAAWPVQSFVKHFRHEFEYFVEHGHSIVEARGRAA